MVECLPAVLETWVRSLGWEDPLEKEMATHSSTLAWKIPGLRSLVGYSPWVRRESDTTERLPFLSLSFSAYRSFHALALLSSGKPSCSTTLSDFHPLTGMLFSLIFA